MTATLVPPNARRREKATTTTTSAMATASMTGVAPLPRENAAPRLKVSTKLTGPITWRWPVGPRERSAQDLLHWSRAMTPAAMAMNRAPRLAARPVLLTWPQRYLFWGCPSQARGRGSLPTNC